MAGDVDRVRALLRDAVDGATIPLGSLTVHGLWEALGSPRGSFGVWSGELEEDRGITFVREAMNRPNAEPC
jgi:hypothetical protein